MDYCELSEATKKKDQIVEWAKELQSLAQAGLFYGHDMYDSGDEGYQTPKVDTRAAIFKDGKILLVCEKGKW